MSDSPELVGVESPAIKWLVKLGYTHLSGKDVKVAHRHLAPVLEDVLKARLLALNPWLATAPGGVDEPLRELRKLVTTDLMPANKAFWENVVHRSNIQTKDVDGVMHSVRFFDAANAANNDFHVVDQFVGANADGEGFRPDLLLFVNGLPLAIIECKAVHHTQEEALTQLDGYQNTYASHFVFNQVCVGLNGRAGRYGAILTKPKNYAYFRMRDDETARVAELLGEEPSEQETLLWALFEPTRFLELITHLVLFELRNGKVTKKLPRHQQWRSIRKSVARLTGKGPGEMAGKSVGGVIWHMQGSGKSLTMAMLARMLRADSTGLGNPSVLVLTDRKDLDQQIWGTFGAIGLKAIQAQSVDHLVKLLSNDYGSVFTSTIHKFQENDKAEVAPEPDGDASEPAEDTQATRIRRIREGDDFFMVEEVNAHFGLHDEDGVLLKAKWNELKREKVNFRVLSNKSNFFVLVDEAHRSQYDFLAAFMRASLPNAKFIAFTGTPLLQDDKHTLGEFGGGEYIDEYRLHEAVADGATLPIQYQEAWVELAANPELEKAFKTRFGDESETRQKELQRELLLRWRHAGERMEKVAEHLVNHFQTSVRSKNMKAMLVCDGRDMAVRYKDLLDAIMAARKEEGKPTFESRVVVSLAGITGKRTGASEVAEAQAAYVDLQKLQSIEERIKAELKEGKEPIALPSEQIAQFVSKLFPLPYGDAGQDLDGQERCNNVGLIIVSDMLLTGWDAPIVGTMYLDKPLREHTLLQAIARVNRPSEGKNAGYIVDYHGVVDYLDHALKIYSGELKAAEFWDGIEKEIPTLQAAQKKILDLLPNKHDLLAQREEYKKDADRFLDPLTNQKGVEDFLELVKQFNRSLDIILPDERAVPFKPYFTLFGEIRLMLRDKMPGTANKERITKLESALLQQLLDEYVDASPAKSLLGHEVNILDASDMARLKKLASKNSQALVMKNQLKATTTAGKDKDPVFFEALEAALEKLLEEEKAGRISQVQFLEQLELFVQQIHDKDNTGFQTPAQNAVYRYLAKALDEDTARMVTTKLFSHEALSNTLASPNWKEMPDLHGEIRDLLRNLLMPLASWERAVARGHAGEVLALLLKN